MCLDACLFVLRYVLVSFCVCLAIQHQQQIDMKINTSMDTPNVNDKVFACIILCLSSYSAPAANRYVDKYINGYANVNDKVFACIILCLSSYSAPAANRYVDKYINRYVNVNDK